MVGLNKTKPLCAGALFTQQCISIKPKLLYTHCKLSTLLRPQWRMKTHSYIIAAVEIKVSIAKPSSGTSMLPQFMR